ncbi:MAG: TonB-dependent receptor [Candidatus Acididesulfobacter diazotrophicus]|jgi:outer membrane receptor protein involved in Fe transport|uniref:TonB-dependent receptor n=1 Tax=Candidatus Acididesulfobacter diazotrophicus TaxID=2597226 RepID=A0A519BLJ8_9DELT|nr:MAG: TonB-dependent receptor [Candidatus Acididesulfobacter diazotrophicus]
MEEKMEKQKHASYQRRAKLPDVRIIIGIFILTLMSAVYGLTPNAEAGVISIKAITKKVKVKRTPFTVSKIKKKTIKRMTNPMTSFESLLNVAPSIHASTSGPNNIRSRVELRGFGTGEVSQTFDGIPINNMFDGDSSNYMDIRNNVPFTLGDVSGVNISYGVNNPSVDTFDSLGGQIGYQPVMPSSKFSASIFGGYGSFATRTYGFALNTGKLWEGIRMYLRVEHDDANNWYDGSSYPNRNHSYYFSLIKPYNRNRSNISFIFMRNDDYANDPHLVPVPLLNQFGYNWGWPTSVENAQAYNQEYYIILGWKDYIDKNITFNNKAFYSEDDMYKSLYINPACDNHDNNANNPGFNTSQCSIPSSIFINGVQPYTLGFGNGFWTPGTYTTDSYLNQFSTPEQLAYATDNHVKSVSLTQYGDYPSFIIKLPRNIITLGAQLNFGNFHKTEGVGSTAFAPIVFSYNTINDLRGSESMEALYAQDRFAIIPHKLFIEPGVKYQYVNENISTNTVYNFPYGGQVSDNFTEIEPTVGLSYNLLPNWNFYATYGRIMKAPNYTELETTLGSLGPNSSGTLVYSTPINTLKPEIVTDYELGTRYRLQNLSLSANIYKESFTNTFGTYLNFANGITYQYNGGASVYTGFQLEAQYDINKNLNIYGNYSLNTGKFTSSFSSSMGTISSGENVPFIPRHLMNLGIDENYFSINGNLSGTYTGEQFVEDLNGNPTSSYHLGGYWLFNLNLSHKFNFRNIPFFKEADLKSMKLSFTVDNIFNRNYLEGAIAGGVNTSHSNTGSFPYAEWMPGMPRFYYVSTSFKF